MNYFGDSLINLVNLAGKPPRFVIVSMITPMGRWLGAFDDDHHACFFDAKKMQIVG